MARTWAEEHEESIRLLESHRDELAAEARQFLAEHPGARITGVVMAPDAAEAACLLNELAKHGWVVPEHVAIVMLWPREAALALLRVITPAQLDWLESDPDKLPLVCVTQHGTRLGWASLAAAG